MARKEVTLALPTDLVEQLESLAHAQCQTFEEQVVAELRRSVSRLSGISCDRLARDQSSELHLTSPVSPPADLYVRECLSNWVTAA